MCLVGTGQISSRAAADNVSALEALAPDGCQLIFSDTPGMLAPAYKLQEVMQSTVSTGRSVDKQQHVFIMRVGLCSELALERPLIIHVSGKLLSPRGNVFSCCYVACYIPFQVRGAADDADVVLLVTDVYGEPLADEKIMRK
jgi:hypothetical protein